MPDTLEILDSNPDPKGCPCCGEVRATCGSGKGYHFYWGSYDPPEPDESYCDTCGFHWSQMWQQDEDKAAEEYREGFIDEMEMQIEYAPWWVKNGPILKARIEKIINEIQNL